MKPATEGETSEMPVQPSLHLSIIVVVVVVIAIAASAGQIDDDTLAVDFHSIDNHNLAGRMCPRHKDDRHPATQSRGTRSYGSELHIAPARRCACVQTLPAP